jgi:hypothetical protein
MDLDTWLAQLGFGMLVIGLLAIAGVPFALRRPRLLRALQATFVGSLGAGWIALVVTAALEGKAIDFTRQLDWFSRDQHPSMYWMSVVIHLTLAVGMLWGGLHIARRPPDGSMAGLSSGDITQGFLRAIRWIILAFALAISWAWLSYLWQR